MLRIALTVLAALAALPAAAQTARIDGQTLQVEGKPFLILGGELGNSSASDRAWLKPHWARLKAMGLNTVLVPISWELVEPQEGKFDFSTLDWLVEDARANGLRLGLLWFGAWKNSMSSYVPAWVKRDEKRFPRVAGPDGKGQEILSALVPATRDADARAFAAMMAHLKAIDAAQGTVILVQVENEVGMLPTAREPGALADRAWAGPVPAELVRVLRTADPATSRAARLWRANGSKPSGTWAQLFGATDEAEEVFTAWHYARYVDAVAAAGKRVYDLPMYANAALARPGKRPGEYPSGGPLPYLIEVWRTGAPSLDFVSPDIYFPDFTTRAAEFVRPGNPLFVPEAHNAGEPRALANALYSFGQLGAIGFSPFSIESIGGAEEKRLGQLYAMLADLAPTLHAARAKGGAAGFAPRVSFEGNVDDAPQKVEMGDYRFTVTFIDPWTPRDQQRPGEHAGMILRTGPEEFLVVGAGVTVTAEALDGRRAGLESVDEMHFADGKWVAGRRLNGDQTHQGRHVRLAPGAVQVQRVRLYRYR